MFDAAAGLTEVSTDGLKVLLRALHRGEIRCPLTVDELARHGLQYCSGPLLGHLRHLDEQGIRAVVVAVIAERLPANKMKALRRDLKADA